MASIILEKICVILKCQIVAMGVGTNEVWAQLGKLVKKIKK